MAMSRRAQSALPHGPRFLSRFALSVLLLRVAMFRAPRSCSNSFSASENSSRGEISLIQKGDKVGHQSKN